MKNDFEVITKEMKVIEAFKLMRQEANQRAYEYYSKNTPVNSEERKLDAIEWAIKELTYNHNFYL